jgi:hypothetical protein
MVGSCEHRNEPSHSIAGERFLEQLSEYQLLKKDSAPWNELQQRFFELQIKKLRISKQAWTLQIPTYTLGLVPN